MARAILSVVRAGPLVTIQDQGRPGLMRYGIAASGPMDSGAFAVANAALGQSVAFPAIEVSLWGKNVTNQANFTNVFNSYTGLGATVQFQGAPRTYGATVKYSF